MYAWFIVQRKLLINIRSDKLYLFDFLKITQVIEKIVGFTSLWSSLLKKSFTSWDEGIICQNYCEGYMEIMCDISFLATLGLNPENFAIISFFTEGNDLWKVTS